MLKQLYGMALLVSLNSLNLLKEQRSVAKAIASIKDQATTIIGGGDSAAAVIQFGFSKMDLPTSLTGGGASLEYLEGKGVLPRYCVCWMINNGISVRK